VVRRPRTILIVVAVVALLGAACAGGEEGEGEEAIAPAAASSTSGRGSAQGDADTDDVRIAGFAFAPKTVTAKVGQKVKWEHQDAGVTHKITALDGTFRSGDLQEGDEFSHVFRAAGSFSLPLCHPPRHVGDGQGRRVTGRALNRDRPETVRGHARDGADRLS
jgi:plastocyanin